MSRYLIAGPVDDGSDSGANAAQQESIPGSGDENHPAGEPPQSSRKSGQRKWHRPKPKVSTREDILAALSRLPLLVATGVISPTQSASMTNTMRIMLQELRHDERQAQSSGAEKAGLKSDEKARLQAALRSNPDLLHAMAPLLSDDELRALIDDADDEQTTDDSASAEK